MADPWEALASFAQVDPWERLAPLAVLPSSAANRGDFQDLLRDVPPYGTAGGAGPVLRRPTGYQPVPLTASVWDEPMLPVEPPSSLATFQLRPETAGPSAGARPQVKTAAEIAAGRSYPSALARRVAISKALLADRAPTVVERALETGSEARRVAAKTGLALAELPTDALTGLAGLSARIAQAIPVGGELPEDLTPEAWQQRGQRVHDVIRGWVDEHLGGPETPAGAFMSEMAPELMKMYGAGAIAGAATRATGVGEALAGSVPVTRLLHWAERRGGEMGRRMAEGVVQGMAAAPAFHVAMGGTGEPKQVATDVALFGLLGGLHGLGARHTAEIARPTGPSPQLRVNETPTEVGKPVPLAAAPEAAAPTLVTAPQEPPRAMIPPAPEPAPAVRVERPAEVQPGPEAGRAEPAAPPLTLAENAASMRQAARDLRDLAPTRSNGAAYIRRAEQIEAEAEKLSARVVAPATPVEVVQRSAEVPEAAGPEVAPLEQRYTDLSRRLASAETEHEQLVAEIDRLDASGASEQEAAEAMNRAARQYTEINALRDEMDSVALELDRQHYAGEGVAAGQNDLTLLENLSRVADTTGATSSKFQRAYPMRKTQRGRWVKSDGVVSLIDTTQWLEEVLRDQGISDPTPEQIAGARERVADLVRRSSRRATTYRVGDGDNAFLKDWGELDLGITPQEARAAERMLREELGRGRGWNLQEQRQVPAVEAAAPPRPVPTPVSESPVLVQPTLAPRTPEQQAAEMRRTAGELRDKSESVGRGYKASYLRRAEQLEAEAEKLSPSRPAGSRVQRNRGARQAAGGAEAAAPTGDVGPDVRPALQQRRRYVEENLRREGIAPGTPEAGRRGEELTQAHREAVRRALEAGQITPEEAVDRGHFVTHPELAEQYGIVSKELGERIASRTEREQAESARKERVRQAHEYFASKRGQRGQASLGPGRRFRNPYEGQAGSLQEDLGAAWEIGLDHFLEGVRTFADWSRRMVETTGEWVREHLPRLYHEVVQAWQHGEEIPEEVVRDRGAEILRGRPAGQGIEPGAIVHSADRGNYGKVVSVQGDRATVHFVSREGTEATVRIPLTQLTSTEGVAREAFGALREERNLEAYDLRLQVPAPTGDPAVKQMVSEVLSPERARKLSEPTVQVLRWYQKIFTRGWAHQDIALDTVGGRLKAILTEQGYDQELLGLAHDPAESMARAATAAGWKFRNAERDGWFDPDGNQVALGMEEIEHLAAFGSLPGEGVRGSAEGVKRALRPRQEQVERFWVYGLARRARELLQKALPMPETWTPSLVEQVIGELDSPQFQKAHAELQNWIHQGRLTLEETGWYGPGWADRMQQEHPNYLPFVRETLEATQSKGVSLRGDTAVPALVRSIKGGRMLVRDPRSQLLSQTRAMLEVTQHWRSRTQLRDWVTAARGGASAEEGAMLDQLARKLAPEELPDTMTPEQAGRLATDLMQSLTNVDGSSQPMTQATVKAALTGTALWRDPANKLPNNTLPVMGGGGKIEFWQVHPDLYEVYALRDSSLASFTGKVLGALFGPVKRLKQATTTTYAPFWILRNILRDIPDAIMQSPRRFPSRAEIREQGLFSPEIVKRFAAAATPIVGDLWPALRDVWAKGAEYRALGRAGAFQEMGGGYRMEPGIPGEGYDTGLGRRAGAAVYRGLQRLGPAGDVAETAGRTLAYFGSMPFNAVAKLGEISEQMSRMAGGRQAVRDALGRGASQENATAAGAAAARQVTLPFERGGQWGKALNRGKAFLSAGFQGLYTPLRIMKAQPVETLIRGITWVTVPTMLAYALNHDNPDWKRLSPFRKYGTLSWPIGKDQKGETCWFWHPLPWVWGWLFGSTAVMAMERWAAHDPQAVKDWAEQGVSALSPAGQGADFGSARTGAELLKQVGLGAGMGLAPDLAETVGGLLANRNWTGRDIVPKWDLQKHPSVQVKDYTSELARLAGRGGASPLEVDYLLDETFASLGRDIRAAVDRVVAETGHGTKPVGVSDQPIFLRSVVGKASQGASDDWRADFENELTRLKATESIAKAKEEAGQDLTPQEETALDRLSEAGQVDNELRDLSKQRREITRDAAATPERKQRELDVLTAEETELLAEYLGRPVPEWAARLSAAP